MTHSTNEVPYDKRLAKKKKFTKVKAPFNVVLNDARFIGTGAEKEQYIRVNGSQLVLCDYLYMLQGIEEIRHFRKSLGISGNA